MSFFTFKEQPTISAACQCGDTFSASGDVEWIDHHWDEWWEVHRDHRMEFHP